MLFSPQFAEAWQTMQKLQSLVDDIGSRGRNCGYVIKASKLKDEYGVFFENTGAQLWFGMWYLFLQEHGFPLCFGIQDSKATPKLRRDFVLACHDAPKQFMGYTVGWIPREDLESPQKVWTQMVRILENTLGKPGQ